MLSSSWINFLQLVKLFKTPQLATFELVMAATKLMDGHIRKRQFQPSITSYFNNRDADPSTLARLKSSTSPLTPPLPAETQASLLSVGMRVRKSVPEGYKTHKTLGEFPFPSTAPSAREQTAPRSSFSSQNTRELTPFCGLHKTGGWMAQEVPSSSAPAALETDADLDEAVPGMTWSQSTITSTQSSFLSSTSSWHSFSRKRTYEDEAEDEMDVFFDEMDAEDEQQRSAPTRPIARMRGCVNRKTVQVVGEDDFEDADFLAPLDGMEVDPR
jgi:hypothetical protein